MAFSSQIEFVTAPSGKIAKISLSGDLDASSATAFRSDIEQASAAGIKKLVLDVSKLEYMASAGLRVLVFAKQKMSGVEIFMVGVHEAVMEVVTMTGMQHSLTLLDSYDASKIEN